jgi:hypothetical protein
MEVEVEPLPQLIRLVALPVDVAERCLLAAFFKVALRGRARRELLLLLLPGVRRGVAAA